MLSALFLFEIASKSPYQPTISFFFFPRGPFSIFVSCVALCSFITVYFAITMLYLFGFSWLFLLGLLQFIAVSILMGALSIFIVSMISFLSNVKCQILSSLLHLRLDFFSRPWRIVFAFTCAFAVNKIVELGWSTRKGEEKKWKGFFYSSWGCLSVAFSTSVLSNTCVGVCPSCIKVLPHSYFSFSSSSSQSTTLSVISYFIVTTVPLIWICHDEVKRSNQSITTLSRKAFPERDHAWRSVTGSGAAGEYHLLR